MEYFGWVLASLSIFVLALVYFYSKGWFRERFKLPAVKRKEPALEANADVDRVEPAAEPEQTSPPPIQPDSKVVTVRILPQAGERFNAEKLVLSLRSAGFAHGEFRYFSQSRFAWQRAHTLQRG